VFQIRAVAFQLETVAHKRLKRKELLIILVIGAGGVIHSGAGGPGAGTDLRVVVNDVESRSWRDLGGLARRLQYLRRVLGRRRTGSSTGGPVPAAKKKPKSASSVPI
jgi:hypothetical protein